VIWLLLFFLAAQGGGLIICMYVCMYGCINDRSAYIHTASCGGEGARRGVLGGKENCRYVCMIKHGQRLVLSLYC
jgi:hypothetical protein